MTIASRPHSRPWTPARTPRLQAWLLVSIAIGALLPSAPARAEDPGTLEQDTKASPLFVLGAQDLGLTVGYGHGTDVFESGAIEGRLVRELVLLAHWQIQLTRRPAHPRWLAGQLAFRAEATWLCNFEPRAGVAGGLGLLLRYRFLRPHPFVPYVQAGAGVLGLDLDLADQSDGHAFMPQGGVGLEVHLGEVHVVDVGVKYQHISNAYTQSRNGGIDSFHFLLGYARRF